MLSFGVQAGDEIDEVRQRSAEPVKPPRHQNVAGLHRGKSLVETRTSLDRAGHPLIFVDNLAAGSGQGVALESEVLIVRADPRVADLQRSRPLSRSRRCSSRAISTSTISRMRERLSTASQARSGLII